ncbi:inositol monophosphatase family protein [Buchnera aphidicola (Ceratovacuna keduensis)]|uniref:inositol monophosphatase family protein n=1 Tax=Buchnera aphidicola TaxID=9 RepID=UPI0031B88EDA
MNPMINIATSAIRKAGNFIIKCYDSNFFFEKKYDGNYLFFNEIIKKSENIIINEIHKYYPNHIYITDKNINFKLKKTKIYWFINSLDGLFNFNNKFPHFCTLISNFINNNIFMSVIYDPLRNELFTSIKGEGSKLNGYRMRCNNKKINNNIILSINISKENKLVKNKYIEIFKMLLKKNIKIRMTGSDILDFAYVASGRLDCLIIEKDNIFNFLSGELQVKESGGLTNKILKNFNININNNTVIVGNNRSIKKIIF